MWLVAIVESLYQAHCNALTTGSRCGTDQGNTVEIRQATELKTAAPGLLEKFCEVCNSNVFK